MATPPSLPPGVRIGQPATLLATWFGVGLLPFAPGSWGSLAALPLAWLLHMAWGPAAVAGVGTALFFAGCWASTAVLRRGGGDDPSYIVIDEVAAQLLVLSLVPADPLYYAVGFFAFRVFDVLKPWPVGWADRAIKGGFGVMFDDVLAAVYSGAVLIAFTRIVAV